MNPKRDKLEAMLQGFQSVARVGFALKVPGGVYPEWWADLDFNAADVSYNYPGMGIVIDDEGIAVAGLKTKGVLFGVRAPWAAVVVIMRPDGSEAEQWALAPEEFPKPDVEYEGGPYLLELPWGPTSRDAAIKTVHMLMLQLGEMKPENMVRFVLAKPPRSAYTGFKLVVDNTRQDKHTFAPLTPPPLNAA